MPCAPFKSSRFKVGRGAFKSFKPFNRCAPFKPLGIARFDGQRSGLETFNEIRIR